MKPFRISNTVGVTMLIGLWGAAFSISCVLNAACAMQSDRRQSGIVAELLGESRLALSGHFYEMADKYFHAGREHVKKRAFEDTAFQKLAGEISPEGHMHISGDQVKEMMPWLWLAVRANPENPKAYLVAAFWLANDANRPDLALNVLNEAQWNNPFNYRVQLERGRSFLAVKDLDNAGRAFDAGLAFWPGNEEPEDHETKLLKSRLLIYRAALHSLEDRRTEAITDLEEILNLYPGRVHIRQRIKEIRDGKSSFVLARQQLDDILKEDLNRQRESVEECHRQHDNHKQDHRNQDKVH
jgi:tetratricopeptide (TPR) repeat protein